MTETTTVPNAEQNQESPLKCPSVAYRDATYSIVYRLSELMFGSLLASYVLGFVSFAADISSTSNSTFHRLVVVSTYLFISVTYAYVTAGQYVSYHAGILTMHHMPLGRLRYDFMLALSQAVLFGIAMLYPISFSSTLGLTFLLAVWRQHKEHWAHIDGFRMKSKPTAYRDDPADERAAFARKFNDLLRNRTDYSKLSSWESAPRGRLIQASLLILLSIVTWWALSSHSMLPWVFDETLTLGAVSSFVFFVVTWRVHGILKKNASLLLNRNLNEMDAQFDAFVKELHNE